MQRSSAAREVFASGLRALQRGAGFTAPTSGCGWMTESRAAKLGSGSIF